MSLRLLFTAASSGIGHVLDSQVQLSFRRRLAARLGRVPIGWFSRRPTGEPAKVIGEDVSAVHPFIAPGELVSAFVVPLVSLIYLITIDWRLTLIPVVPAVGLREQEEFDAAIPDAVSRG
ncbi:ABC transporter transmembrane domain-containing protein [Nonomuraea jabiensis]|uniref:ABC transporter transmembrane domain-containing protein n=1 Tax=Nonomuraea jabiensis TaxID=882448 RepID=UPI003D73C81A